MSDVPDGLSQDLVSPPPEYQSGYEARVDENSGNWVESFGDPRLVEFVNEAIERNFDLYQAAAARQQALLTARVVRSGLFPRIDGVLEYERDQDTQNSEGVLLLELQASWEVDLWGRVRAGTLAAYQTSQAALYDYEYLQQSLAAAVANAWYTAVAAEILVRINTDRVDSESSTADVSRRRAEAGAGTPLDQDFARANLAFARDELIASKAQYTEAVRSLELLLGRYPGGATLVAAELPELPGVPELGVPMELLERRPDLLAAEARVAAAFRQVQVSKLARLPRLRLTGSTGVEFDPAESVWTIAGDILAPIFNAGEISYQIAIADTQQRAAMAAYVSAAATAFGEVETSLSNERFLLERSDELTIAVERLRAANETAQARYEAGVLTIFELNQIRQNYYRARIQLIAVQLEAVRQRIALHLSIGGSFRDDPDKDIDIHIGDVPILSHTIESF